MKIENFYISVCKIKIILFLLFINIAFGGVKEDIVSEASDCLMMPIMVDGKYDRELTLMKKKVLIRFS